MRTLINALSKWRLVIECAIFIAGGWYAIQNVQTTQAALVKRLESDENVFKLHDEHQLANQIKSERDRADLLVAISHLEERIISVQRELANMQHKP